ncbi:TonB-dependent receptor [Pedobacter ginsengisoli]|uniref:TonB-dependent receptor n=1 Tax=Pedobacter ginsengisoli TaxID=363852 RepID=UPI00254C07BB|nr:TonB-dependent receptor [Pedobacter ginsengisoli]
MRLTTVLLIASLIQVSAASFGQKITLNQQNVPLKTLLKEIRKQSGYNFLFDGRAVTPDLKASIRVSNASIDEALRNVLVKLPFEYEIQSTTVLIKRKTVTFPEELSRQPVPPLTITGRITNENGEPLVGATIRVKNGVSGTSSGAGGNFNIQLPEAGGTLVVSFVGHQSEEITISKSGNYIISLRTSVNTAEEIVVVGYGVRSKSSLTGSVVSVDTRTFADLPVVNPYQAMQGRTPGLRITQSSGQPGSEGINLNIRGPNSFATSNSPLVIVDGIVGSLTDLDPSFIQTITVLKDASSAAIYGARAANGVILVTTKKGTGSPGLKVEYTGKYINQSKTNWPDRIWNSVEYMEMLNLAIKNGGGGNGQITYPDSIINKYRIPSELYPDFNHEEFMMKNVNIGAHNLSISGKTDNTTYRAALGAWNQDGIVKGFEYKKYNAMFNMDSKLNEKFKFGITINGILDKRKESAFGSSDMILSILSQMPTYKPYVADGSGKYSFRGWAQGNIEYPGKSPIGVSENGGLWRDGNRLQTTAYTEYEIIKGLTWLTKAGLRYSSADSKAQMPLIPVYNYFTSQFEQNADNRGTIDLTQQNTQSLYKTLYSTLNYRLSVAQDHIFDVLAGVSQEDLTDKSIEGFRRGYASPLLDVLSAGPTLGQTNAAGLNEYRLRSFFGRLNYSYKNKYLLESVIRADGSSRFVDGHNYGTFPSLSAGWRISEETFMRKHLAFLSNLKVSASYGELGNDAIQFENNTIANYPYQSTLNLGANYFFDSFYPGVSRSALANRLIMWEATKAYNLKVDFDFVRSLLYGSFEVYNKKTEGILRISQLPGYAGLGAPFVNEGIVQNKGYEVALGHRGESRGLIYSIDLNLASFKNKLVKFGAPVIGTNLMKEGVEMNRYFMYQADGIYQNQDEVDNGPTPRWPSVPGDVRMKDINQDGKITPDDRVEVSGVNPDYTYGLSLYGSFKGFDLSVLFQGEHGRKTLVNNWVLPFSGRTVPLSYWQDGAWTPGSGINDKPRIVHGNGPLGQSNREVSTFWLKDVSYTRLKFLTLGYTLPNSVVSKLDIGHIRVFANAENLLTLTDFEFGDPEGGSGWSYPTLKSFSVGLNVQF